MQASAEIFDGATRHEESRICAELEESSDPPNAPLYPQGTDLNLYQKCLFLANQALRSPIQNGELPFRIYRGILYCRIQRHDR